MDRRLLLGIGDTRVISVWGERWSGRRTMVGRAFAANADDDAAARSAVWPRSHRQQAALNDQRFDHSVNPAGADSSRARGGAERRAPAAATRDQTDPLAPPGRGCGCWPTSQFRFCGIRLEANDGARAFGANGNPDALEPQIQLPIIGRLRCNSPSAGRCRPGCGRHRRCRRD